MNIGAVGANTGGMVLLPAKTIDGEIDKLQKERVELQEDLIKVSQSSLDAIVKQAKTEKIQGQIDLVEAQINAKQSEKIRQYKTVQNQCEGGALNAGENEVGESKAAVDRQV